MLARLTAWGVHVATLGPKNDSFIELLLDLAGRARPADMTAMGREEAIALLQAYAAAHPEKNLAFDGETLSEVLAASPAPAPAAPAAPPEVPVADPAAMPAWGVEVGAPPAPETYGLPPEAPQVPDFGAAMQGTYPPSPPADVTEGGVGSPQPVSPFEMPDLQPPVPPQTAEYGIPQPMPSYGEAPQAGYPAVPTPYGETAPQPAYGEPAPQPYGEPATDFSFGPAEPAVPGPGSEQGYGDASLEAGYGVAQEDGSDFYELPSMPADRPRSRLVLYVALAVVVLIIVAVVALVFLQPSLFEGILPANLLPGR